MRDRKLDRLFERYRSRGDVNALGEVFDGSAPELLRVASSLVHEPVEADDLLQATYLTAIEKADTYDARRRLVPWLLGILVHHAHDMRRKRARVVDPERLVEREVEDPEQTAVRAEATENLHRAIAGLPARYREVLEAFVEDGKRPAEIAQAVGRAPGTVRMQIHRGLDLLRKALPLGVAPALLVTSAGKGLAAVRQEVLRVAAHRAPALAAGAVTATTSLLGGFSMAQKAALLVISVALVGGLTWMAGLGGDANGEPIASPLDGSDGARTVASNVDAGPLPLASLATSGTPGPEAPTDTARERVAEIATLDYEASLAFLEGRVIEEDGTPVPGVSVRLLELGFEFLRTSPQGLFASEPGAAQPSDWLAARAVTDQDGHFRLTGARPDALHGLGIDVGGERPHFQLLDAFLAPGEPTDLGDVVLPAVRPTRGRVVDEQGQPLAGVGVRAGALNDSFEWERFASIDLSSPVLVQISKFLGAVVELPPRLRALEEDLPFVRTTTGADGTFLLPGAPADGLQLLLSLDGRLGKLVTASEAPPESGQRDLGDIVMLSGRTLAGRVIDGTGEPVVGAEVLAGTQFTLGWFGPDLVPFGARAITGPEGRFELGGIEAEGDVVFAARYDAKHAWVLERPSDPAGVTIDLPSIYPVTVRLLAPGGEPLDSAELVVVRNSPLAVVPFGALLDAREPQGSVERIGPGYYEVRGLQKGNYVLRGKAPGLAIAEARIRPRARSKEVRLEFELERALEVHVLDASTGAPLSRARVALVVDRKSSRSLAEGTTDASGTARLRNLPAELDEDAHLRVEHPRFATRNQLLEAQDASEPGSEIEVRLERGGGLLARCRYKNGAPLSAVMIELDLPVDASFNNDHSKRFSLSDVKGDISFSQLPPGRWRWRLFERYLDGNIWELLSYEAVPPVLLSGEVNVQPGERAEVDIDLTGVSLSAELPQGTAGLGGVALLDDGALQGYLTLKYLDEEAYSERELRIEEDGSWGATELPTGRYSLALMQQTGESMFAMNDVHRLLTFLSVDLEADRTRTIDFRYESTPIRIEVRSADGKPVPGADVALVPLDDGGISRGARSDAEGVAHVVLMDGGRFRVRAAHDVHGLGAAEIQARPGAGNRTTKLVLDPGVPCSGEVRVPLDAFAGTGISPEGYRPELRWMRDGEARTWNQAGFQLKNGAGPFQIAGIQPGLWRVTIQQFPMMFAEELVEIGPEGVTDLLLEFRLPE